MRVAIAAVLLALVPSAAQARVPSCKPLAAKATAGKPVKLTMTCRTTAHGTVKGTRTITAKPKNGTLTRVSRTRGTALYRARDFAGVDLVRFRLKAKGRTYQGAVRIKVTRTAAPTPPTTTPAAPAPENPAPAPAPGPVDDGLPPQLPDAPSSVAYGARNWTPTARDTCPKALHERFSVIGPDGKKYPTWHPPVITNPATGQPCTFGHEHGRDPRGSDIYGWVAEHLAAPGREPYAGIPFGLATEALNDWSAANPGTPTRAEDNVGYKLDYENDVRLTAADGADLGVTCDYLTLVHQGSHSPDATSNNVHELLRATRCSDGTELISDTIGRFGDPGEYQRACDPAVTIATTDNGYPGGSGGRAIPDRTCATASFLVPVGRTTSIWALYEKWTASTTLSTAGGSALARFDSGFGVFNPSRYADPSTATKIARSADLCFEVEPNGDRANGVLCDGTPTGTTWDDPASKLNGTYRDVYLRGTDLSNGGGPRLWYTDPYGGNASPQPFAGAVCQLIGTTPVATAGAAEQVFGRGRSAQADGVHAPN